MNIDAVMKDFLETVSFDRVVDWHDLPQEFDDENELRDLGGPGSGNFGHAGRPGEVGGSSAVTVFHGTTSAALDSIKRDGIKPRGGKGADEWIIDHSDRPPVDFYLSDATIADRHASVFVTDNYKIAKSFGRYASEVSGGEPVVLKLNVPASEFYASSKQDESSFPGEGMRFRGTIKPEWIKGRVVEAHNPYEPNAVVGLEETKTLYVVFVSRESAIDRIKALGYSLPLEPDHAARVLAKAIRALGGPGSGNFGHAGRPGEVGGSVIKPGWEKLPSRAREIAQRAKAELPGRIGDPYEDFEVIKQEIKKKGEALVYHGTADTALNSILKEGLKPHGGKGGDYWAETEGDILTGMMPDTARLANTVIGGRDASVFFTTSPSFAKQFADYASDVNPHSLPLLLEIKVPKTAIQKMKFDELSHGVRFEGTIPPQWIKSAKKLDPNTGIYVPIPKLKAAAEDDSITFYAVIMVEKEPATLGGPGSGNFGHAGRPGEVGGSSTTSLSKIPAEHLQQRDGPIPLYHSGNRRGAPAYDAFYGNEEFNQAFPNEFGPETHRVILPTTARILDLNKSTPSSREFIAEMAERAWKDDRGFAADIRGDKVVWTSQGEGRESVYEAWTDKRITLDVLTEWKSDVDGVVFEGEYLLKKELIKRLPGKDMRALAHAEGPLHEAADSHVPKLSVAFRYAFAKGRKAIVKGRKPNVDQIVRNIRSVLLDVLPSMLLKVVNDGGQVGADNLRSIRAAELRTAKKLSDIRFEFDLSSQAAIDWADKHSAELIDNITETSREQINNAIADLIESGDWDEAYDEILDAVGDPGRAERIARNETMLAASEGQRQAWGQAVEAGLLTGDEKRVWIATPDEKLCPICEELDGTKADLNGEYPGGYDGPPAHVLCRCTEGIA